METPVTEVTELDGVSSVTVRARGIDPGVVLDRAAGAVRGFWARGDRWVAHRGAVARITIDGGAPDPSRFRELWRRASPILDRVRSRGADPDVSPASPRFYGGFAFRGDEARPETCWTRFPAASFVLPSLEVIGRADEAWITLRARRDQEGDRSPGILRERAEGMARELREADLEVGPAESGRPARLRDSDRAEWTAAVEEAIAWIERDRVSKVVLARTLDLLDRGSVDPAAAVLGLWHDNPGTHVFLFEPVDGSALVGAAPETIATVSDGTFRATAVAGSISRGAAPEEQEALAFELLESEKDRVEHAFAVQDMVERLRPLTDELSWDSEPHVLTLSRIQHLETRIKARLRSDETVLSALAALHPTPAVCGLPRDAALDFLRMEEPFDRGWYAGPVGWFDAAGDGVFAPALRSGVREGERWRLFAGAGIVAGSDPALEWEETRIKFEPMLRALDADGDGDEAG